MAKRKVDGLNFKAGPTQSGALPTPTSPSIPIGGEIVDINAFSVFLSKYWLLIAMLLISLAFILYKKRIAIPKWFFRLMYLFE